MTLKDAKKRIEVLSKQIDEQQETIKQLQKQHDYEFMSQIFITRDEYPAFDNLIARLEAVEKRMSNVEKSINSKLALFEADAVEQHKMIEHLDRRMTAKRFDFVSAIFNLFAAPNKHGSLGRRRK